MGSLEPGKLADFAIHDYNDYRELPYFFGRETAQVVYIGGVSFTRTRSDKFFENSSSKLSKSDI